MQNKAVTLNENIEYCKECNNIIYVDEDVYYLSDGDYLCSEECVLKHLGVQKIDEYSEVIV